MISPNVLKILYRLKNNGHVAYLVGGGVRDLLLGREPKDFDVATDATPGRIKKLFRNCRLVGRRFRLAHLHFRDEIVEVSTFRAASFPDREGEDNVSEPGCGKSVYPRRLVSEDGLVLRDNVFGSPGDDARRRDFTINALAYNIADFSILDFVGGLDDLRQGVIRTIGDPSERFVEDPVRMLRAVRFASRLGFTVQEETWRALMENASTITWATPPRLYEEILKLFLSGKGETTYHFMRTGGLFTSLFPTLDKWLGGKKHHSHPMKITSNLQWIDKQIEAGNVITPSLMLSLLFGEYLESLSCKQEGHSPSEAMHTALESFFREQNALVAIPHRVALAVREIMVLQKRFGKIPGKRSRSVIARQYFRDALAHLRCRCEVTGAGHNILSWWEHSAEERNLSSPVAKKEARGSIRPRRRGKRRNRVSAVPAPLG